MFRIHVRVDKINSDDLVKRISSDNRVNWVANKLIKFMPNRIIDMILSNHEGIINNIINNILNKILTEKKIPINIKNVDILEVKKGAKSTWLMIQGIITLEEIDYQKLVEVFVPKFLDDLGKKESKLGALAAVLKGMEHTTKDMILAAINVLSPEEINDLLIKIFKIYDEEIIQSIQKIMNENQLSGEIIDVKIINVR